MSRSPISWNANQLRKLRESVRKYNAAVTRMAKSGKYDVVPNYTSVEEEKKHIYTRDQLRTRTKQLDRILKKNKPDSDRTVTTEDGLTVPKYLTDEIRNLQRVQNEKRRERREELLGDYTGTVRAIREAEMLSNSNLVDYEEYDYYEDEYGDLHYGGDDYYEAQDLTELVEMEYPDVALYADQYLAVWAELGGNDEIGDIVQRFLDEDPMALVEIFDSGDDRIEIEYIYPDKPSSGTSSKRKYNYDRVSAYRDPLEKRQQNVLDFWREMESEYLG